MTFMINQLRELYGLSQDQITFSELTKEGEKFVGKKTYADGGGVEDGVNFYVVIDEKDDNFNKVGYSESEIFTDNKGDEYDTLHFGKSVKKYNLNDIWYLQELDEFKGKGSLGSNYKILYDDREYGKPYFYIVRLEDKKIITETYDDKFISDTAKMLSGGKRK